MSEFLFLEDLHPGDSWTSAARTVTETDIVNFAGMTGDFDPLHVDHEFAANTPFGKPIAHGILGLAWMAGLSSTSPRVRNLALISIDEWRFHRPVFVGDTLHVQTDVESITSRGRRGGEVVWLRKLISQRRECVQSGRIVTLVSRHTPVRRKAFAEQDSVAPDAVINEPINHPR